jgi:hypothetical protein
MQFAGGRPELISLQFWQAYRSLAPQWKSQVQFSWPLIRWRHLLPVFDYVTKTIFAQVTEPLREDSCLTRSGFLPIIGLGQRNVWLHGWRELTLRRLRRREIGFFFRAFSFVEALLAIVVGHRSDQWRCSISHFLANVRANFRQDPPVFATWLDGQGEVGVFQLNIVGMLATVLKEPLKVAARQQWR